MLSHMSGWDPKHKLHHYLQIAREARLLTLDGLSEYAIRRVFPEGTRYRRAVTRRPIAGGPHTPALPRVR